MKHLLGILLILTIALLMGASSDASVTLHITPLYQFERGKVLYTMRISQHRDNFWYCYGWENQTTEKRRTSCQQLNGIYAPRIFQQEYRDLDPGVYTGFIQLYRAPNYLADTATQEFIVALIK